MCEKDNFTLTSEGDREQDLSRAKRIVFMPSIKDRRRIEYFEEKLKDELGLPVYPTNRELFGYILDLAQLGDSVQQQRASRRTAREGQE